MTQPNTETLKLRTTRPTKDGGTINKEHELPKAPHYVREAIKYMQEHKDCRVTLGKEVCNVVYYKTRMLQPDEEGNVNVEKLKIEFDFNIYSRPDSIRGVLEERKLLPADRSMHYLFDISEEEYNRQNQGDYNG